MNTPPPVNLSALQGILANAKKVMNKVDSERPIALSESVKKETAAEESEETPYVAVPKSPGGYTKEQVMASKFPQAVKEAMLKSIPKPTIPVNTRLEDTSELEDIKMIPNKRNPILKKPLVEQNNRNSDMITISKTDLDEMISNKIMEFLTESYNKTLTENAIKKTINVLIKEGKLNIKK